MLYSVADSEPSLYQPWSPDCYEGWLSSPSSTVSIMMKWWAARKPWAPLCVGQANARQDGPVRPCCVCPGPNVRYYVTQCWYNSGSTSATLAHHWSSIGGLEEYVMTHSPANTRHWTMLFLCWVSIEDGGATFKQHWFTVSCYSGRVWWLPRCLLDSSTTRLCVIRFDIALAVPSCRIRTDSQTTESVCSRELDRWRCGSACDAILCDAMRCDVVWISSSPVLTYRHLPYSTARNRESVRPSLTVSRSQALL